MSRATKRVAVLVPMTDRTELTRDEEVSMRHLLHFLNRYDKFMVVAEGLDISHPEFEIKRFPRRFFGSADAYKRLVLSRDFYESFADYEYILIYHLDALAFSDQLLEWCDAGFDYIGAPWLNSPDDPDQGFRDVGNGGFSLRRVSSCLRVMDSPRYRVHPDEYWQTRYGQQPLAVRVANMPRKYLKYLRRYNGAEWEMARYRNNCDVFWARRARHYDPEFRIAPVETALRFAFECAPAYCYERNGRQLPFGCHAWARYDRAFWTPFLLPASTEARWADSPALAARPE